MVKANLVISDFIVFYFKTKGQLVITFLAIIGLKAYISIEKE